MQTCLPAAPLAPSVPPCLPPLPPLLSYPSTAPRRTKVVCTIGPTSCDRDSLFRLADSGMSVVRLNMSHGDHASHKASRPAVLHQAAGAVTICDIKCPARCGAEALPSRLLRPPACPPQPPPPPPPPPPPVQAVVDLVREYNNLGRGNLAIMLDTKGPGALCTLCCLVFPVLCSMRCALMQHLQTADTPWPSLPAHLCPPCRGAQR